MAAITLSRPVATRRAGLHALERLHLFGGRAMGEVEFDLRQAYLDYRLQQLGNARRAGIVRGLEFISPQEGDITYLAVSAGLATTVAGQMIGLSHMVRAQWHQLMTQSERAAGAGLFYLTLERSEEKMEGSRDRQQPCHRHDPDPLRDRQKVIMGQLRLRRTPITAAQAIADDADTLANQLCQQALEQGLTELLGNAIPLALVALNKTGDHYTAHWIRAEAGRYLAIDHSAEKTLLTHYSQTIQRIVTRHHTASRRRPFNDHFEALFKLRYLPTFGSLPLPLLEQPDALPTPTLRGLPGNMNIDMVPVPQSTLEGIMEREIGRGTIDLHQPYQSLRLLLAVRDEEYRADLLDRPDTDDQIENDLYRYHQRSHNAWLRWQEAFNRLYYWSSHSTLSDEQKKQLRLPTPVVAPVTASDYFQSLIDQEREARKVEESRQLPLPYRDGVPSAPPAYTDWLEGSQPPIPAVPETSGLAVKYLLNQTVQEEIRTRINTYQSKLDKVRDLLLKQRQLLDINTIAMATLAGGVNTDGSGLQIARWWPYMAFDTEEVEKAATPTTTPDQPERNSAGGDEDKRAASNTRPLSYSGQSSWMSATKAIYPYIPPVEAKGSSLTKQGSPLKLPFNSTSFDYLQTIDTLALVTNSAKQKLSEPQFKVESAQFGVMKHLDPALSEYRIAHDGLNELFDDYQTLEGLSDKQLTSFKQTMSFNQSGYLPTPEAVENSTDETVKTGLKNRALFRNSRVLTRFITRLESQNDTLTQSLREDEKRLKRLLAEQARLSQQIEQARKKLHHLETLRVEYQGDYAMAQALVREEWNRVEKLHEARSRVLNSLTGLYFVKVRRTPVSRIIRQPQPLHHKLDQHLIPGCGTAGERELPESLDLFFDAVLEVPLNSWAGLTPYLHLLPGRSRIDKMARQRQQRLAIKNQGGFYRQANHLNRLFTPTQALFFTFAQTQISQEVALTTLHQQVKNSLSLEDIQSLPTGELQQQAQTLRQNLTKVLLCLLDTLRTLSPSLRLQWAQLAEDDRIPLSAGSDWPGMEEASRHDADAVRRLLTLVGWWIGQQSPTLSSSAANALRDMIRALLIEAALGEPEEIVRGRLKSLPPRFRPGERFRLTLNREAQIGLNLHLLNPLQQIVGIVRLEEEDEQGPVARITEVNMSGTTLTTEFTVIQVVRQLKMG